MVSYLGQSLFTIPALSFLVMASIENRVEEARTAHGWNQPELARRINVTKQAISQIESGTTKNPKPETLLKIADVTGYELRWLISGTGPKTRKDAALDTLDISNLSNESKAAIRAVMDSFSQSPTKKTNHNS